MSKITDRLRAIAAEAERLAESISSDNDDALALDLLRTMVPAATLKASKALNGTWWAYLVMPKDWKPERDDNRWMYNENQKHFWTDFAGETELQALKKAWIRLIELAS